MGDFLIDALVDSGYNPITLEPEYDYAELETAVRSRHRTVGHVLREYDWGTYLRFEVPLRYLTSADAARMAGWWRAGDDVFFTRSSSEFPSSVKCRIVNDQHPFPRRERPYSGGQALFQGGLVLEATDAGSYVCQPLVLDDDVMGLLDQTYNALG